MSSSNFNIRLDDKLKSEVSEVLAGYGLSPAQAVKLFFNQVVATRKVPLSFDFQSPTYPPVILGKKTIQSIEEGRADYLAGKLSAFSGEDAIKAIQDLANEQ